MISNEDLKNIGLFEDFDGAEREAVVAAAKTIVLATGEHLFNAGDPATQFFYVRRGQVKLTRWARTGNERVIAIIRPGETFAEAAIFLEAKTYPVTAQALGDTEVVGFSAKPILALMRNSVDLCLRLISRLSSRLHGMVQEIDKLTLHNATFRLVHYLLEQPQEGPSGRLSLTTPKMVLASRLSIKPETLSRILHSLVDRELIEVHGNDIWLKDMAGLQALIENPI